MYYVYALIDPRNNKPFYIGKGSGDRVTSHEKFASDCNNPYKDNVIKKILGLYPRVPYEILKDGFENENDAYDYEENVIFKIGIENLTNICESRRPPSQLGKKRQVDTIEKIKNSSKFYGNQRTIQYVKDNSEILYNLLKQINLGKRRATIVKELNITVDLFNKVKSKYDFYIDLLNIHTEFKLGKIKITKINGMRLKLFSDNKQLLIKLFELKNNGIPRREIIKRLGTSPDFYDRVKNFENEFKSFLNLHMG